MSVLIKDMEKPKSCYAVIDGEFEYCPFVNTDDDCVLLLKKGICEGKWEDQYSKCPLVETSEPCEDEVNRRKLLNDLGELITAWEKYPVMAEQIKGVEAAIGYVETIPSVMPKRKTGKWIPCSERLPEPRVDVWVNSDIGQIQGYYEEYTDTWYASFGQGRNYLELIVNAWMPLLEPYKPEEENK